MPSKLWVTGSNPVRITGKVHRYSVDFFYWAKTLISNPQSVFIALYNSVSQWKHRVSYCNKFNSFWLLRQHPINYDYSLLFNNLS